MDIIINALVDTVLNGMMTREQIPIPFQEEVNQRLESMEEIKND